MNVREHLLALNDELRRLKGEGGRNVIASDASLAQLRQAVETARVELASAEKPLPEEKETVPSPTANERQEKSGSPRMVAKKGTAAFSLAPLPAEAPVVTLAAGDKQTQMDALRNLVLNHTVCRAHVREGKRVVVGVGDLNAKIFFCGEAPGADEEVQGEPFVGPAGQLLTKMIHGMGLQREEVYIGNIMNWRPEMPVGPTGEQIGNRPPTEEEMNFCLPFLRAQLAIVQPEIIVALGATATKGLLGHGAFKALGEVRGHWHEFEDRPLMVTYHPSYILRNQSLRSKREIWEDLLQVMERAALPISDKQRGFFLS
ncbi:MAG: uracil-DNA glycosylase [Candidatus Didemnitutus sp.]|nr:uracil-DNA glycosylase [Candidatus Didemnitutus sp.]